MVTLLLFVFFVVCLLLSLFILVQSDKGGGISGAVGGGFAGANTVIGAQNAENILTRGTVVLGTLFFALAVVLFLVSSGGRQSVSETILQREAQRAETQTEAPAPAESFIIDEVGSDIE